MENTELSEIQHFYKNSTVFLTGCTGFVGKLLLEKLLRQCYVNQVYVLIREKNGVNAEARCTKMFEAKIFDVLKRQDPEFSRKVSVIVGNLEKPNLGISTNDKDRLINEVDCIFHCAANTKLDAPLKEATMVNVRATRDLLELAKEIENLKTFVYISTVFSNFSRCEIHEVIYDSKITAEKLINITNLLEDDILSKPNVQSQLLDNWPNVYTFTKQTAEELLKEAGKTIPISVVRASHVISIAKDPIAGYIENVYSLSGLVVANALGINRVNYYKNNPLDVIPVDYVVNELIASGWYTALQKFRKKRGDITDMDVLVYHCITSQEKPLTSDEWMGVTETACREVPSTKIVQLPLTFNTGCYYNFQFLTFILHTCLGFLCDMGLKLVGKKPMLVEGYKKWHKFQELTGPYLLNQWYLSNDHTQKLLKRMSFKDRELFNFDVLTINWEAYFSSFARGLRVYIMKDPMSTLSEGRKQLRKKLYIQLLSVAILVVVLYGLFKVTIFNIIFR